MSISKRDGLGIIPEQIKGKAVDAVSSYMAADEPEAISFYQVVKKRLLAVNEWHQVAGIISAAFQLTDAQGNEITNTAHEGFHIRIDIPGPGSKKGGGYDWVKIEQLSEVMDGSSDSIGFRVRPSSNPKTGGNIAHFYSPDATSSFVISRKFKAIDVCIADRNLLPNKKTESLTDSIRHTVVGTAAMDVFSKFQWQNLADGLIKL
ncbi:MAG: hypothetical protein ABIU63_07855 [Chitinophagaceae bacterium]